MPAYAPYSGITINSARRLLTRNFEQAGIEGADFDARLLIEFATGLSRSDQIARGTEFLTPEQFDAVSACAARRMEGEPVDAIIGTRAFWKDIFRVTSDVLSPRPETEGIIEAAMKLRPAPQTLLDLGTGSGAVVLSLLREFEGAAATACDISPAALDVAKDNAARLGLGCDFILSNWFENISGRFDLIVSNPPYITDAAMLELPREVLNFDPDLALRGGPDGLGPYKVIADKAQDYLTPGGHLILEIGFDQGIAVRDLLRSAGFEAVNVLPDLAGRDRIVTGRAQA